MQKKQKNEYINNTLLLHPQKSNNNKNLKVKSTIIIDQIQNNILDINQIKIKKNNIIKKDFNKKKNNNNNYNKYKSKGNIFLIFYFFSSFLCFVLCDKTGLFRKMDVVNEIVLTAYPGDNGKRSILYNDFSPLPDQIYVNGELYTPSEEQLNVVSLSEGENIIKLIYNTVPTSLKSMFKDTYGITAIDLTNFDSSSVNDMSNMFNNCGDLIDINFGNFDTSSVTNMEGMFQNLKQITSLNLSTFDTSKVTSMKSMFTTDESLEYLNVQSFDTSSVRDMSLMFCDCQKLESIDISSFSANNVDMGGLFKYCLNLKTIKFPDTKKLKCSNLGAMFQDCQNLISVDLSSFDTSEITSMNHIFDNCYQLVSANLSSFDTSRVENFQNMFSNCNNLESLDLSNFNTASAGNFDSMFYGCSSLIYLNLKSFIFKEDANINYMFTRVSNETIICYEDNRINQKYSDLGSECNNPCFNKSSKLISESKQCVEDCSLSQTNKFEYNSKCYSECPSGTIQSSTKEFLCLKILVCPNYYNMDKTECFDTIEDGYFLSDENQKLLDKCHENCKTCNKKGLVGNTNCLTCNSNYYFYNGNCLEKCKHNSYKDDNNNLICTCETNKKCKECSEEPIKCKSCNEGFYSKYGEISPFDCHDKLNNYYLKDNYFYQCYSTCKKCSGEGDYANHNCDECKETYKFIDELNKPKNCYLKCDNYYYINSNNEYACTEKKECPNPHNKLITEKKKCIDNCANDNEFPYEYKGICYEQCPGDRLSENYICLDQETDIPTSYETDIPNKSETDIPNQSETDILTPSQTEKSNDISQETSKITEITEKNETVSNWSAERFFLGLYISDEKYSLNKDEIFSNIQAAIINRDLDSIIGEVIEENEDKFIKEDNALFQITTSDNQNNNNYFNVSTIKLGECETILKYKYDIDENDTLIILKIDYNITGLLIPIIGYEVFHPKNKSKLNLSYCEETSIHYNIPVKIEEEDILKYDPNSVYYTDECNTYTTENGTDILINDRIEEFNEKNMSLCENICDYAGYNTETKKVICECGIRYKELILAELDSQTDLLSNKSTSSNSSTSNLAAMKCYELVFSKEGLLENIGSYIIICIIILHLVSIIIFYKCGYQIIDTNIQDILDDKKKLKKLEKKTKYKNNKKSIYITEQKIKKSKYNKLKNSENKIIKKKKKTIGNPQKKKRINEKNMSHQNTSVSNNIKSFTKLRLKNNKKMINFDKEVGDSTNKIPKKKIDSENDNINIKMKKLNLNFQAFNDFELNTMNYKDALEKDKRSYFEYYLSLIRTKHPVIFSFFPIQDFNIFIIKICIFFLSFSINYAFNAVFFDSTVIHNIYKNEGNYDLVYLLPKIFYSFIISYIIIIIVKFFSLPERDIIIIKNEKIVSKAKEKVPKVERCVIIKNICYFIISIVFLILFWYYLSSFGALYKNSQVHLIKNTFISFIFSLVFPFFINLIPGIFRRIALSSTNKEFIYKISKIIQIL